MVLAVLLTIRKLTGKPKSSPLPDRFRGALSLEEQEEYDKLHEKGPRINLEKKTDYKKLTHDERFENVSKSFGEQEKLEIENKKNSTERHGLPIFAMVSSEAEEFLEENEEKFETTKKETEKLQKEKTKTNFQQNLDKIVLGNTRAIFERNNKGELNVLAIESLIPIENVIDNLKTEKPQQKEPQTTQMERPKIVRRRP